MKVDDKRLEKNNSKNINAIILLIYIYMPFIINILENTFSASPIVNYLMQGILILYVIIFNKINKKTLLFLCFVVVTILINYIVVDYKYYVLIEGIQALLGVAIPCLVMSQSKFDLEFFLRKWYKFSKNNLLLVILSIILLKKGMVHYSIFTSICVPNVFIIATMILFGKEKDKKNILIAFVNIFSIIIFGGRMAGVVSLCMMIVAIIYSSNITLKKKIIIYFITTITAIAMLNNFEDIVLWTNKHLNDMGMHSRSLTLFIDQMTKNELYVTGRDEIYTKCIDYIKIRGGLPGGFGVPLYLTNGEYYYSHNLILQLLITFGLFGTILLIILIYSEICTIKKYESKDFFKLIIFMLISYILIGMTGSSIWIHYMSTMFIALVFFRNHKLNKNKEKWENEEDIKKI